MYLYIVVYHTHTQSSHAYIPSNPNRTAANCTDIIQFSPPDGSSFNLI